MDEVYVKDMIVCTKMRRGSGQRKHSPIRVVKEIFDLDGEKIAENDPCGDISPEVLLDFLKYHYGTIKEDEHTKRIHQYFIEEMD